MKKLKIKIIDWLFKGTNKIYEGYNDSVKELEENYLFDFKNYSSQYYNSGGVPGIWDNSSEENKEIKKIKIKPIDVLNQLEIVPTPFDLLLIDEKLSILKDKEKLIAQNYAKREIKGLIERITNRKRYLEFKEYFDKFQNTTDEKIDNLLSKYDLVMKTSDIFIPEFPSEAIVTMKEYTKKVEELSGKKPLYYVIAEEDKFRKAYEKRDPILLVQSPFGFYWQILGAWDKEMLILGEL